MFALTLFFVSCGTSVKKENQKFIIQGFVQGTTFAITYLDTEQSVTKADVDSILLAFDHSCSIYIDESVLSAINNNTCDTVDTYIKECLEISSVLYQKSDSLYDVTIKPLVEAYGFIRKEKSGNVNIDSLKQFIGFDKITISDKKIIKSDPRVQIDLNSIAQGYSVDIVARYFDKKGIKNYIIEIGGELFAIGRNLKGNKWRVGIDKPIDGNLDSSVGFQAIIELDSLGLATSGNYRKFYEDNEGQRVNHTINPKTGLSSTNNLLSATILAPTAAIADGYATVCMVSGFEKSISILNSDSTLYGMLIYSDGDSLKTYVTKNLENKIISAE